MVCKVIVEEYLDGPEVSVEVMVVDGIIHILQITDKITTGAPHFVETAHLQPAPLSDETKQKVRNIVEHALDSLYLKEGASHTEVKIDEAGNIRIIEIGGRMGGDCIGGVDFVKAVIQVALGEEPANIVPSAKAASGVRFVFDQRDLDCLERIKKEHPEYLIESDVRTPDNTEVLDSSERFGFFVISAPNPEQISPYLS